MCLLWQEQHRSWSPHLIAQWCCKGEVLSPHLSLLPCAISTLKVSCNESPVPLALLFHDAAIQASSIPSFDVVHPHVMVTSSCTLVLFFLLQYILLQVLSLFI
ncbi:hypothetical protein BsWGS_11186 [Bradybaena similaris]